MAKTDEMKKKELRAQYENRHPDMGIAVWKSGGRVWVMATGDAKADFNSTAFKLELGSFPNKEMQKAYDDDSESFVWSLEERLDYEDLTEDHSDDLELMLMEYLDRYPEAKRMKPVRGTR